MSLLKKAAQAAMVAKERAEDAKEKLDELRAERDAASVKPVMATPLDGDDRDRLARALALGATDPTMLLSYEEACELAGMELGTPRLMHDDMAVHTEYVAEDRKRRRWAVRVGSWYLPEEPGAGGAATWEALDPAREVGDPVPGVGGDAFAQDAQVFAWAGDVVFSVEVALPDDPDASRQRSLEAARRIAARL